jgi:PAS domain-containing protein
MDSEHRKDPARTWLPDVRMSVENLSTLVNASPLGIIAVGLDRIIGFWNKAAERLQAGRTRSWSVL